MSVYVDEPVHRYGRMIMCHMIADTREELFAMVDRIGVHRKWLQAPGTYREHFDISKAKRSLAVKAGAIELTSRELVRRMNRRREVMEVLEQAGYEVSEVTLDGTPTDPDPRGAYR